MSQVNSQQWDAFLSHYPDAHLLQTNQWGEFKSGFGWKPVYLVTEDCGAAVLFRQLPLGLSIAYIPKGPVGVVHEQFMAELDQLCKACHAVFLKIEPDAWQGDQQLFDFQKYGYCISETIQPRRTIAIDLTGDENLWLERMKQKTRYNIHLAQRKGILIEASDNLDVFYDLMTSTGQRDAFGIHSKAYYGRVYRSFLTGENCQMFIASYQGQPLAGLMAFIRGKRAWYFYGASNEKERNRMPTYLLQWEAMKWAASRGCESYDLWGVPDEDEQILESSFADRSDGLWGVYRFKRGFGGQLMRSANAWNKVYKPLLYKAYQVYSRIRKSESAG